MKKIKDSTIFRICATVSFSSTLSRFPPSFLCICQLTDKLPEL